jgi:hypothetical protein
MLLYVPGALGARQGREHETLSGLFWEIGIYQDCQLRLKKRAAPIGHVSLNGFRLLAN